MGRLIAIIMIVTAMGLVIPQTSPAASPPSGFPGKALLSSNPKEFWTRFGAAVNAANPGLSTVGKGKKIVEAIDAYHAHYSFEANTGGFGRVVYLGGSQTCGDWTKNRLQIAFKGAGIDGNSITSVESEITSITGYVYPGPANRVHQAAALKDSNGDLVIFDVWQQGYDHSTTGLVYGSVKGVGKSKYNGQSMADWVALQKKYNRSKITIGENLLAIAISSLAADAQKIILKNIKENKCEKVPSLAALSNTIREYAEKLAKNKWRFDPHFLQQQMIADGKLKCSGVEISSTVLLLLDTSGSMRGKKLDDAKQAAISAINSLPEGVEIGLMTYSGGCSRNFPFLPFNQDKEKLIRAITSISAGGGTPMAPALQHGEKAIRAFGHGKSAKIILLCDGQNDCSASPVKAAATIYKRTIPVSVNRGMDLLDTAKAQFLSTDSHELDNNNDTQPK